MPPRGHLCSPVSASLVLAALAGCLPAERSVDGVLLHPGRDIQRPSFVSVGDTLQVTFEVQTSPPSPPRSGVYEVWTAAWDAPHEERRLVANIADRDLWPQRVDARGTHYLMTDERFSEGPAPGASTPIGTLTRFDFAGGVTERIPDVVSYTVSDRLKPWLYRSLEPGARLATLHFRSAADVDRALGPSAGAAQIVGDERLYFVTGDDRTLSRITSIKGEIEPIRGQVQRFLLRDDEEYAVLSVVENGRPKTIRLDLKTGLELPVPGSPCCWLFFSGPEFVYAEAASAGAPGRLHAWNVETDKDRVIELPPGLSDVTAIVGRPRTNESLFFDSRGRVAQHRPPDQFRLLELRPMMPSFTADGRFFVYIDPKPGAAVPEGTLMVQEAGFQEPPRPLSLPGTLVPDRGYFFLADGERQILVFWAHFGRGPADLYYADPETGEVRLVAEAISEVTVTPRRVLGIIRVSQQDLVGDLVHKDIVTGEEQVLAHRVADATFAGARVAFVVRERIRTRNDGLWATCIAPDEEARQQCLGRRR